MKYFSGPLDNHICHTKGWLQQQLPKFVFILTLANGAVFPSVYQDWLSSGPPEFFTFSYCWCFEHSPFIRENEISYLLWRRANSKNWKSCCHCVCITKQLLLVHVVLRFHFRPCRLILFINMKKKKLFEQEMANYTRKRWKWPGFITQKIRFLLLCSGVQKRWFLDSR